MNSSAVSVYDNVKTPENLSKSNIYRKLNDLLQINTEFEARIFCPLCVSSFSFKFSLFEHLRTFHESFLTQVSNQSLKFNECPFCQAKFYGKHLTAKHVLRHHSKVIKDLLFYKNRTKCLFCNIKLDKKDLSGVINHIEELHFLDFEEEFRKMFSCDTSQEVSMSELINSTLEDKNLQSPNWEDVCMKFENTSTNKSDFEEASRINCYDFSELKQQLDNISDFKGANSGTSNNKSILKDIRNIKIPKRSARRVLRFDLPTDNEHDKENIGLGKNPKPISAEEHNFFCDNETDLIFKPNNTFNESPQHCSTPNFKYLKENKKSSGCYKSTFKSYISERKNMNFEFQCGKCRLLFRENFDLVSHVKNNHKFSLKAFQPCYHCAICDAKFYKNRYLKKHHNLHKPY